MSVEDLLSSLQKQSNFVSKYKGTMYNEEHTKLGFIIPFFKSLGYNMHCPDEVITEYACDFGIKKGEKVDFAIMKDKHPYILVEAKHCDKELNEKFASQLSRYFNQTDAKLGILTNGIQYWFYSDFDKVNVMDTQPFFKFDILNISEGDAVSLHKFTKDVFFIADDKILTNWKLVDVVDTYYNWLDSQMSTPTRDILKLFCSDLSLTVDVDSLREVIFERYTTGVSDDYDGDEDMEYELSQSVPTRSEGHVNEEPPGYNNLSRKKDTSDRHKNDLVIVNSSMKDLYQNFRLGYLRDDIIENVGKHDLEYVSENDASYIVKMGDIAFDFLCAKDAFKVDITFKGIFGVLINSTVYRLCAWHSLIGAVVEHLYREGYTRRKIISISNRVRSGRVLYDSNENRYFVAEAQYRGISFNKRLSAMYSMRYFLNLLSLYDIDLNSVFIILYDPDKGKNTKVIDEIKYQVDAQDIVLK